MIIGHEKQREFLESAFKESRLGHAYLFSGEEKIGKKAVALEFAESILKINRFHPDFLLIEPEGKEIKIGQIRDFIWRMSLTPVESPLKIGIIDNAHLMNTEAQNCLLKTLEEPKGNALIILVTSYPHLLLRTILSRCENLKFFKVESSKIENFVSKNKEIIALADGKPGLAMDLFQDEDMLKRMKKLEKDFSDLSKKPLKDRFSYAKEASEGDIEELLGVWLAVLRAILKRQLEQGFQEKKWPEIKKMIVLLEEIIFFLKKTNVNSRLAIETLMISI